MSVEADWNMRCPKCGKSDQLDVTAIVQVRLTSDGTLMDYCQNSDHEWDDDSRCRCDACGHAGVVADFNIPEEERHEMG